MSSSFFRGTSTEQTSYFADKERKMLADYIWPKSFESQIDLSSVSLDMVKSWLCQKVADLTGTEDEILIEFILNSLLDTTQVDPRTLTVRLTGFLGDHAFDFVASLWKLLLDAQQDQIPEEFQEAQNKEVEAQKLEAERIKRELAILTRAHSPAHGGAGRRRTHSPGRRKYGRYGGPSYHDEDSNSPRGPSPKPAPSGLRGSRRRPSLSPSQSPPRKRRHYSPSPKGRYGGPPPHRGNWERHSPYRRQRRGSESPPPRGRRPVRNHDRMRRDSSRSPSPQRYRQRSPPRYDGAPDPRIGDRRSPSPRWRRNAARSPSPRRYTRDQDRRPYPRSPPPQRSRRRSSEDLRPEDSRSLASRIGRSPVDSHYSASRPRLPSDNGGDPSAARDAPTVLPLRQQLPPAEVGAPSPGAVVEPREREDSSLERRQQGGGRQCYMDEVKGGSSNPLWLSSQAVSPVKRSSSEERLRALALQTLRRR